MAVKVYYSLSLRFIWNIFNHKTIFLFNSHATFVKKVARKAELLLGHVCSATSQDVSSTFM